MLPILQHFVPQRGLSRLAGILSNSEIPWLKNHLIRYFLSRHPVKMEEAKECNPFHYASFNAFFTRQLKPHLRPIAQEATDFACPADGSISQMGNINTGRLIQAKGHHFDVRSLLGGDADLAHPFHQGSFLTIYLAPQDYHRLHMPLDGQLTQMIYVPGNLFSVNTQTANAIPNLFARNERVIAIFKTAVGKVAIILVGAMLVGSIETPWAGTVTAPHHAANAIQIFNYANPIYLKKGEEMGHFKLGSTVIVLLEQDVIDWDAKWSPEQKVQYGQRMGSLNLKSLDSLHLEKNLPKSSVIERSKSESI